MTERRFVAWDTETALIAPGLRAPPLTCVTTCCESNVTEAHPSTWPASLVDHIEGVEWLRYVLDAPETILVGHNVAFDMCVMMSECPDLIPAVFSAYADDRITDTMHRQELIDIARGEYRGRFGSGGGWIKYDYSLDALTRRLLRWPLEKDEWRLRYGEVRGVPISTWEEGRREYPKHDARATLGVCLVQSAMADDFDEGSYVTNDGDTSAFGCVLHDEFRQARRFLALSLMEAWGLRTDPVAVEQFAASVDTEIEATRAELVTLGLVRPDGSRNTKAAARLMIEVCEANQLAVLPTKGAEKKIKAGVELKDEEGVCLDADACKRTEDWRLELYAEYVTLAAVKSKDLPILRRGAWEPIHTRFGITYTSRSTSSGPNIQNVRNLPGIRECFVPRPGWVFANADYPSGELHTLAQLCIDRFGYSRLADVLNAGEDPHLSFAARMLGIDYTTARARLKAGDAEIKLRRKMAKPFNFGKPGGMGVANFIKFASRHPYFVNLSVEEATEYGRLWIEEFPEMKEHLNEANRIVKSGRPITYSRSPGIRGDYTYTSACNDGFQRLLADITSDALWNVARECYDPTCESVLYGSRPVNFVHDEIIMETVDDTDEATGGMRAHNAVTRMAEIMREDGNRWCPDVPFDAFERVLMSHWSKEAQSLVDDGGVVRVWHGKAA